MRSSNWRKREQGVILPLGTKTSYVCNRTGQIIQFRCFTSKKWRLKKINQIRASVIYPIRRKTVVTWVKDWGWGEGGDQLKKICSIGKDLKSLSEGTGRSAACGFLIKHWPRRSVFKGKSFFRKVFYVVDINNHSKTSVSFSLYLIQHNKAESYIRNWTLYHATCPD